MRRTLSITHHIELESDEIFALDKMLELCTELYGLIPMNGNIMNLKTGECICDDDIARIRGIINGLLSCEDWTENENP